jgi:cytosine deaminase
MLDALSMLVHVAQMTGRTELFRAWEMVTTNPARAAEVPWGVREGLPANFVVFDCADEAEAIRLRPAARWVVRNGRIVAETEPARSVVHENGSAHPVTFRRDPAERGGASTPPEMAGAGPIRAWIEEGVER